MTSEFYEPFIKVDGDIVLIPLGKGKHKHHRYAMVDEDEVERVIRHKWYAAASDKTFYARATCLKALPAHHRNLHNFILRTLPGERVDHENGDGLDCRKGNLRKATPQQNSFNTFKTESPHVTSRFKGVSISSGGKWIAQITKDGSPRLIGLYAEEEEAAKAYDAEALKLFGAFAKTNDAMGLFDGPKVNRNREHGAYLKEHAPSTMVTTKPAWERLLDGDDFYKLPSDVDDLAREVLVRQAVNHIKNPRERRKQASLLRRKLDELEKTA